MLPIICLMKLKLQISQLCKELKNASNGDLDILKVCVEKHCNLVRYNIEIKKSANFSNYFFLSSLVRKVENCFGPALLFQSSLISIFLCILMFKMIHSSVIYQFNDFIYFFGFFCVMLLKIALPCFFAQQMMTESEKLVYAAYNLPWFESDRKFAKNILILMAGVQRIVKLRIHGFYDMDFIHLGSVSYIGIYPIFLEK